MIAPEVARDDDDGNATGGILELISVRCGLMGRRRGSCGGVGLVAAKDEAREEEEVVVVEATTAAAVPAGTPLTVNLSPTSFVYLMFVYSRPAWALFCSGTQKLI